MSIPVSVNLCKILVKTMRHAHTKLFILTKEMIKATKILEMLFQVTDLQEWRVAKSITSDVLREKERY